MHYHLIGIGGIGMSALALLLFQKGHIVSGSDLKENAQIENLREKGIFIQIPQDGAFIKKEMRVVYSTAIDEENAEIKAAKQLNLPIIHRSIALKEVFKEKKCLCIAGAHGKTSTSSMLSTLFLEGFQESSYSVGGIIKHLGSNSYYGKGEFAVIEADESDGSFLRADPDGAIITSTDADHLSYWKSKENLLSAYGKFIELVKRKEHLFLYEEDPFLASYSGTCYRYGFSSKADVHITSFRQEKERCYFSLDFQGSRYKDLELEQIGRHQVLNASAAIALSLSYGMKEDAVRKALAKFKGVKRRLELLSQKFIPIYDDYAHHPKEIFETLKAVKEAYPTKRVVAVLQPHRYTRLQDHFIEFTTSLEHASLAFLLNVYSAGEKPIEGINEKVLFEKLSCKEKHLSEDIASDLHKHLHKDDICVFLGAGDVTAKAQMFAKQIEALS